MCASCSSDHLRMIVARSFAVLARQAGQALLAASMARRVSLAPKFGAVPMRVEVAGLTTVKVALESASIHAPST